MFVLRGRGKNPGALLTYSLAEIPGRSRDYWRTLPRIPDERSAAALIKRSVYEEPQERDARIDEDEEHNEFIKQRDAEMKRLRQHAVARTKLPLP